MFLAKSENRGVEEGGSVPSSWQIRRKKMNIENDHSASSWSAGVMCSIVTHAREPE